MLSKHNGLLTPHSLAKLYTSVAHFRLAIALIALEKKLYCQLSNA
jgi:hypothetical protein